ncbi:Transcriptional coactivator/pterin dehydratase [Cordyceps fumosorosea ARSEF 2679]|uniref:4a-hydroxytetrahydrobiopterin dehydratase n=1 Tax=Cordyceps fumosorosea (strain ARSEF 2679) TaxID=1081104 RepID=A0A167UA38_CORFA|nr:Transcriptional coactivator/pterin dehydratase [Cordyceps fumosorosea ARSEF 2679]OAA61373.1 Transcriptional coactivator/pterin dehydratase [Cordyceps fumosorosea ARSEF 2679]
MSSDVASASPFFGAVGSFSTMPMPPSFAPGTDKNAATEALRPLITPDAGGRWSLTADGYGIERSFKFATFAKTWEFMNAVAAEAKKNKHHPEWSNVRAHFKPSLDAHRITHLAAKVYNTTFIRWTTHNPKGLAVKDLGMATTCDFLAKHFGEVEADKTSCNLSSLADTAAASAGDCCVPKKK